MARKHLPGPSTWAELREAQSLTTKTMPNTGLSVTIDIGDAKDVHPKNKQDVGKRLTLVAKKIAYGKNIVYSGPRYVSMKIDGNKARIKFDQAKGQMFFNGEPKGFAIAGSNRKFIWANARIEGDTVIVWSAKVDRPVAVRYGWANNPEVSLYNKANLPAEPFRTDNWPGITRMKK